MIYNRLVLEVLGLKPLVSISTLITDAAPLEIRSECMDVYNGQKENVFVL